MKKLIYLTFLFLAVNLCFPSIASAQVFSDDFESGNFNQWTTGSSSMTYSVVSSPAIDQYSLQIAGSNGHVVGLRTTIPNTDTSIEEISWMIRTSDINEATGYVIFLDSSFSSVFNCVFWCRLGTPGVLRFSAGSPVIYDHPARNNTWYGVKVKNINWNSRTFDIYINDTLRRSNFPFRGSLSKANTLVLYNFRGSASAYYDNFIAKTYSDPNPICVNSFNTTISQPSSGQNNGAIDVNCNNGATPLRYARWSKRTGDNYAQEDALDLNNADAGTYYLTLITLDNCIEYLGPYRLGN
jgi:hypothetical protein